jgi:hypothetical protein
MSKVGDSITFKKLKWEIVKIKISIAGIKFFRYRVYRKYFGLWLNNTDSSYLIFEDQWKFYPVSLIEKMKKKFIEITSLKSNN